MQLQRLAKQIGSHSVIKPAALTGILALLIALLLSACSSVTDETLATPSSSESTAAVPGEHMSEDGRYAPGPMGSSSVRW